MALGWFESRVREQTRTIHSGTKAVGAALWLRWLRVVREQTRTITAARGGVPDSTCARRVC